jgi:hypothetical protein
MSLWALLPAAVNFGVNYMNRPQEKDYRPNTKYLEKYISSLRGRQNENQTYRQMMEPGLRQIGSQTQQARHGMEYDLNRMGMGSSGAAVAGNLALNRQALDQTSQMHSQAAMAQAAENRAGGDRIIEAEAQIGQAKEAAQQQYDQATRQWRNQMVGGALGLAAEGVAGHMQQVNADQELLAGAQSQMSVTDPSLGKAGGEALTRKEAIQHFGSVANYVRALQKQYGLESANYYQDVMTGKVAPENIDINKLGPEYYNAYVHSQIGEHKQETASWERLKGEFGPEAVEALDEKFKANPMLAARELGKKQEIKNNLLAQHAGDIRNKAEKSIAEGTFNRESIKAEIGELLAAGKIDEKTAGKLNADLYDMEMKAYNAEEKKKAEAWRGEYYDLKASNLDDIDGQFNWLEKRFSKLENIDEKQAALSEMIVLRNAKIAREQATEQDGSSAMMEPSQVLTANGKWLSLMKQMTDNHDAMGIKSDEPARIKRVYDYALKNGMMATNVYDQMVKIANDEDYRAMLPTGSTMPTDVLAKINAYLARKYGIDYQTFRSLYNGE